ncbi:MAG: hypothetical protein ACI9MU_003757 [Alphaproteobacteria bacterium]|jgi:hypothetical protein
MPCSTGLLRFVVIVAHAPGSDCYTGQPQPNQNPQDRMLELSDETTSDQDSLRLRLSELQTEHRDLDDVIARITDEQPFDQLQVQRLKKRKLGLKDEILKFESELLPDIIA